MIPEIRSFITSTLHSKVIKTTDYIIAVLGGTQVSIKLCHFLYVPIPTLTVGRSDADTSDSPQTPYNGSGRGTEFAVPELRRAPETTH